MRTSAGSPERSSFLLPFRIPTKSRKLWCCGEPQPWSKTKGRRCLTCTLTPSGCSRRNVDWKESVQVRRSNVLQNGILEFPLLQLSRHSLLSRNAPLQGLSGFHTGGTLHLRQPRERRRNTEQSTANDGMEMLFSKKSITLPVLSAPPVVDHRLISAAAEKNPATRRHRAVSHSGKGSRRGMKVELVPVNSS